MSGQRCQNQGFQVREFNMNYIHQMFQSPAVLPPLLEAAEIDKIPWFPDWAVPEEVFLRIANFLDINSLSHGLSTCKRWHLSISKEPKLLAVFQEFRRLKIASDANSLTFQANLAWANCKLTVR